MEHHQPEQTSPELSGIGHNRPTPSFVPARVAAAKPELQEHAGAQNTAQVGPPDYSAETDAGASSNLQQKLQLDEPATSLPHPEPSDYEISVDEILIRLREVGIEKSKDSVQRYCREGALDCRKLGLFKRYFATEKSLAALIEKMQPDEDARNCIQLNVPASIRDVVKTKHTDAPASNGTLVHRTADGVDTKDKPEPEAESATDQKSQPKTTGDENLADFLKDEIRVKNKQLEVKDTQIAAMLERDHETNILIRGLQNQLGETFAMLSGRSNREKSKDEKIRNL